MERFYKNSFYFHKKLHLKCLTGLRMRLWYRWTDMFLINDFVRNVVSLSDSFHENFWGIASVVEKFWGCLEGIL